MLTKVGALLFLLTENPRLYRGFKRALSRNDLEQIEERVVTSYRKLPEFNGKTIYSITPSVLIEKVLKIKMEYHHLSLDGSVLGVTTSYSDIGYRVFDIKDKEQYFFLMEKQSLLREISSTISLFKVDATIAADVKPQQL